jgi:hypothetical protein
LISGLYGKPSEALLSEYMFRIGILPQNKGIGMVKVATIVIVEENGCT